MVTHSLNSREYLSGKSFCLATYGKVVTRPLFKKDHHYSQSKKNVQDLLSQPFFFCQINLDHLCGPDDIIF